MNSGMSLVRWIDLLTWRDAVDVLVVAIVIYNLYKEMLHCEVQSLVSVTLSAVTDPGDEVIFISPPWFFYEALIAGLGDVPVRVGNDDTEEPVGRQQPANGRERFERPRDVFERVDQDASVEGA